MANKEYTVQTLKGDEHSEINIGIEDASMKIHLPALGAMELAFNKVVTTGFAGESFAYLLKGGDQFSEMTIDILDADAGAYIPWPNGWDVESVLGTTMTTSENHIMAYQSGAPLLGAGESLTKEDMEALKASLQGIDLNKALGGLLNGEKGKAFDPVAMVENLKENGFGELGEFSDLGKNSLDFLDKFSRGEDGAAIFVTPGESGSTIMVFASEPDKPDWNIYAAKQTEDGYKVISTILHQEKGEINANNLSIEINTKGFGWPVEHPEHPGDIMHVSTFTINDEDNIPTRYSVSLDDKKQIQYHVKNDNFQATYDKDKKLITSEGTVPDDMITLEGKIPNPQKTFTDMIERTENLLADSRVGTQLDVALDRVKDATGEVDITSDPADAILTPGEFVDAPDGPPGMETDQQRRR